MMDDGHQRREGWQPPRSPGTSDGFQLGLVQLVRNPKGGDAQTDRPTLRKRGAGAEGGGGARWVRGRR
ncbi:hypothetical protein EVAR_96753_1 [Eumeta japonica]|uniref:Uncharacterized protein n=1 Tax=Eumeta variegata TaxID=151549 RepID=A0A4C1Y3W1_EUMVA|nr:hypothetical protein EVAR_96753_1 [Eumeta japonica]